MDNNTSKTPSFKPKDIKRTALIAAGILAGVVVLGLCIWFFWIKGMMDAGNADPVYVSSISSITGLMSETDPRYTGLVEPQELTKINKDDTRTVSDIAVQKGDQVHPGDVLFRYDTDEMQLSIRQKELELEGIANQLTTLQDQKTQLEKEKKDASSDDQFKYTVEIQSVDLQIKTQEYDRSVKQTELEKLKQSLENNEVICEVEGTIEQVNLTPQMDSSGQMQPFIAILSSGEYRIKGTVTEMNIDSIYEGQAVTVRSRVESSSTWHGTIETISHEPVQDNNYYFSSDSGEKSSKYNFYVAMNDLSGLMLGQHVYIEPDLGVTNTRTGMWLPAMYVVADGDKSAGYVWARDEEDKLEKRQVLLGNYDEGEDLYEILSGLEISDYIAVPSDELVIGGPTTTDVSAMLPNDGVDIGGAGDVMDGIADNPGIDATDPFEDSDDFAVPEGGEGIMPRDGGDTTADDYTEPADPYASGANLTTYNNGGEGSLA